MSIRFFYDPTVVMGTPVNTSFGQVSPSPNAKVLNIRLDPTDITWTYKLNTQTFDTYGGQVIQVLSCNIDQLTISGQFGKEGPRGSEVIKGRRQWRDPLDSYDYRLVGSHGIGLTQMTEFFREYFSVVSQGGDPDTQGRYLQVPMILDYPDRQWKIFPISFPSYARSNDNFAPLWRVIAYVVEAPESIEPALMSSALQELNAGIGYTVRNPFSDPDADPQTPSDAARGIDEIASQFKDLLPKFTFGEIQDLIWRDLSMPNFTAPVSASGGTQFGSGGGPPGTQTTTGGHGKLPPGAIPHPVGGKGFPI